MSDWKLYMVLVGANVPGRYIEQHDIFFGIGQSIEEMIPAIREFWPVSTSLHIDGWREVNFVDGHKITVIEKNESQTLPASSSHLFFLNLGGYKPDEFEEFHYKLLCVGPDKNAASLKAKQTAFFKHTGFKGATSHIDERFGIDVDDIFIVKDILSPDLKERFSISIIPGSDEEDEFHLGYIRFPAQNKV